MVIISSSKGKQPQTNLSTYTDFDVFARKSYNAPQAAHEFVRAKTKLLRRTLLAQCLDRLLDLVAYAQIHSILR